MGINLPQMGSVARTTTGVTSFAGLDRLLKCQEYEFAAMTNMETKQLPVMSTRPPRRLLRKLQKPNMLAAHDRMCWVDGTDLYCGGRVVGQVEDSRKTFVRMGAQLVIWPDKVLYNVKTDKLESLENNKVTTGTVNFTLCRADGTPYEGYAVGKAPREALEKAYSHDLFYQEAVNETFPAALVEAIAAEDIQIAAPPALNVETIGPDGYTFTALIDLYPEVKLGQYKGLSAPWENAELSDDDTNEAIQRFLTEHLVEQEQDRAAMGDEVTLDFEGFVDGVPFEGGKGEGYPLLLGSGMFIPGFEEQVAGIRPEEERDVHVTFPTQYVPELAGKDATFHVKAHRIVRRSLPQLTDAFAQEQGFEDVSHLRRSIMEQAILQKQQAASNAFAEALMQQVVAGMEVQLPDSMVESQLTGILQELQQHLESQGASLSDYLQAAGLTMEDLRDHARENAVAAARYELAMTEIVRQEGITVTEEELEEKYREMAALYGMTVPQLREQVPPARLQHDLKLAKARAVVVDSALRK